MWDALAHFIHVIVVAAMAYVGVTLEPGVEEAEDEPRLEPAAYHLRAGGFSGLSAAATRATVEAGAAWDCARAGLKNGVPLLIEPDEIAS